MKFEMIGKGSGGNCVFLVKNLSDNKVCFNYNNDLLVRSTQ
jgi:hypothetical protein